MVNPEMGVTLQILCFRLKIWVQVLSEVYTHLKHNKQNMLKKNHSLQIWFFENTAQSKF